MADRPRFRLNSPQAVGETVDGEAIVVNLGTGTYYSIKGDSLAVWEAIAAGATVDEVAEIGAELIGESRDAVAEAIDGFCTALAAEGLIIEREPNGAEPPAVDLSGSGRGLLEPSFETYADMQDLILLDPVHEVDERGWPHPQPAA
jgi:hypothetical protein